jgi:hypothetical protein
VRWLLSGFVGFALLSSTASSGWAQSAPSADAAGARGLAPDGTAPTNDILPAPKRELVPWEAARIEIALGRLQLSPYKFRVLRKHEAFAAEQCERSYQVTMSHGAPALRATFKSPHEAWALLLDTQAGTDWVREFDQAGQRLRVHYQQPPLQPIRIEISRQPTSAVADAADVQAAKPEVRRLEAPTLWHLTEASDEWFVQYVLPSLYRLNPRWDLHAMLEDAKRLRPADNAPQATAVSASVAKSIAGLDSPELEVRSAAKQELRQLGLSAQIPLEQALRSDISTQQRQAILALLEALKPQSADSPTRLAYWLSGDPAWR